MLFQSNLNRPFWLSDIQIFILSKNYINKIYITIRRINHYKMLNPKDYFMQVLQRDCKVLVSVDGTWHHQVNFPASNANRVLGLIKSTFSSWSDEIARIYLSFIHQPSFDVLFFSQEPKSRIRLKNKRKCSAQSNPHLKNQKIFRKRLKTFYGLKKRRECGDTKSTSLKLFLKKSTGVTRIILIPYQKIANR